MKRYTDSVPICGYKVKHSDQISTHLHNEIVIILLYIRLFNYSYSYTLTSLLVDEQIIFVAVLVYSSIWSVTVTDLLVIFIGDC